MKVPLLDLGRQNHELHEECLAAFERVLKSSAYVLGKEVSDFERAVARYSGSTHAIGISSGTDALLVAMMALDIGPGDEVLVPSFTFFGTAGSIVRLGATPVWVDVLPDTYNIDLEDALDKVTERTRAIVPVHLFGQMAEMECVLKFAQKFNLYVLEDAAQSIGAEYQGSKAGTLGDFGVLSFYPTKNLGGFGDGGMLLTQNPDLADKAVWLRNHGMNPKYYHRYVGGNFRLDALQAALLGVKLPLLEGYHSARTHHAEEYISEFKGHSGIELPRVIPDARSVWNQFTIRVRTGRRDEMRAFLAERGIGSEVYYPVALHRQECFQNEQQGAKTLSVTDQLAKEVLSLPVFPEMTSEERAAVIRAVWDFGYPK